MIHHPGQLCPECPTAVPAGLAGTVTAAVVGGAAGATGKAFLIAKGAMNMMMWANIKIVAGVAAVLLVGSMIGVVSLTRTVAADGVAAAPPAARPAVTRAAPRPATIPVDVDPAALVREAKQTEGWLAQAKRGLPNLSGKG